MQSVLCVLSCHVPRTVSVGGQVTELSRLQNCDVKYYLQNSVCLSDASMSPLSHCRAQEQFLHPHHIFVDPHFNPVFLT